jgi:uncharacterized membrane protein YeiH
LPVPVAAGAPAPPVDPFAVANVVGLLAFAVAGALKAADADLDLFGVVVLGVLTALGGGVTRDVLVGRVPAALTSSGDVAVALVGVVVGLAVAGRARAASTTLGVGVGARVRVRDHPAFLVSDAVGLAAFAATGALVGVDAGLTPFGAVVLATLTAVGGGSIADLMIGRTPSVLREDFYATPAVLGGSTFALAAAVAPTGVPTLACFAVTLGVRLLALRYDWHLPTV